MHVILFLLALLSIVAGCFTLLAASEVAALASSAMHEIYAAEMAGNAILLLGFGFVLLGIASIIERFNEMNLHLENMSANTATTSRMLAMRQQNQRNPGATETGGDETKGDATLSIFGFNSETDTAGDGGKTRES